MLPRTCVILLLLSLLSAAASVVDRTTSVSGAKRPLSARAAGSVAGQRSATAGRRPLGRARGQATQARRPGRRPAKRRPQRRPGQQPPDNPQGPRQSPAYLVCYLYPAGSPAYQDIRPTQPVVAATNAAPYPPYVSYRTSQPANAGNRANDGSVNKLYWPQVGYPAPPYPIRLVCPLYQPVSANAAVSPVQVSGSDDSDPDNVLLPDDPNISVVDVDPGIFNLPDIYEPSRLEPEITYPAGGYEIPQTFG